MDFIKQKISGLYLIKPDIFPDRRGVFIKPFNYNILNKHGFDFYVRECYYTISAEKVIRGMHFQNPPHDHDKIVFVTKGSIRDVVLDIRINSPTYGEYEIFDLNEKNKEIVLIPSGCAHGFLSKEDNSMVTYLQTSVYNPEFDTGIKYDSFGLDWEVKNPVISERDNNFIKFSDFKSNFF